MKIPDLPWKTLFIKFVVGFGLLLLCMFFPPIVEWQNILGYNLDVAWRAGLFTGSIIIIVFWETISKQFGKKEITKKEWEELLASEDVLQRRIQRGMDGNQMYRTARGYNFGLYPLQKNQFGLSVAWRDGTIEDCQIIDLYENPKVKYFSPAVPFNQLLRVFGKENIYGILQGKHEEKKVEGGEALGGG